MQTEEAKSLLGSRLRLVYDQKRVQIAIYPCENKKKETPQSPTAVHAPPRDDQMLYRLNHVLKKAIITTEVVVYFSIIYSGFQSSFPLYFSYLI